MMKTIHIKSIIELHRMLGLKPPVHPLISLIEVDGTPAIDEWPENEFQVVIDYYMISQKVITGYALRYGRNTYDFSDGVLMFAAPGQVFAGNRNIQAKGWVLCFHPDIIYKTQLGQKIREYTFFSYEVHEALHVSEEEKKILTDIAQMIREEYSRNIDNYTQDLIVSQLEVLLNYAKRFFGRQFITRKASNSDLISRFEAYLNSYFCSDQPTQRGLPSVNDCAKKLGMSPDYLSDMLKHHTGKSTQEHIHYHLIDRAKTQLLGTSHTVSEIAYALGFEYPQYFSKLFKFKTGMTPVEFRKN
jgi:AraC-like DNA-binding protein